MKHLILTTSGDAPRSATSYAPSNTVRLNNVAIDPTKGSSGLNAHARCPTLMQEVSQSRVARLRHSLISNSLSIILSQWMVWILVFYPQVGPMHHPRQQVLNLEL